MCRLILNETKNEVGDEQKKEGKLIDCHKIIAAYIKTAMVLKIFKYNEEYKGGLKLRKQFSIKLRDRLANECFCLDVLILITHAWGEQYNQDLFFQIPKGYEGHFLRMLYRYQKKHEGIDVLLLAHIVYLLELAFDCSKLGKGKEIYPKVCLK